MTIHRPGVPLSSSLTSQLCVCSEEISFPRLITRLELTLLAKFTVRRAFHWIELGQQGQMKQRTEFICFSLPARQLATPCYARCPATPRSQDTQYLDRSQRNTNTSLKTSSCEGSYCEFGQTGGPWANLSPPSRAVRRRDLALRKRLLPNVVIPLNRPQQLMRYKREKSPEEAWGNHLVLRFQEIQSFLTNVRGWK